MKTLKRIVSIVLIAAMIFTSSAMVTLAENEVVETSLENVETSSENVETSSENVGASTTDTSVGASTRPSAFSERSEGSATKYPWGTSPEDDIATASEADVADAEEASTTDTSVGASSENVGASIVSPDDDIATASEANDNENVATASDADDTTAVIDMEKIEIASESNAQIKIADEELFGATTYTFGRDYMGVLVNAGVDFDTELINITFEKYPTAAPTTFVSEHDIPNSNGLKLYIIANAADSTKSDIVVYAPADGVIQADASCWQLFGGFISNQVQSINNLTYLDTSNATNMTGMFYNCAKLTSLDLSGFDTSRVTSMAAMFQSCESLTTLDLSSFDTSNVTGMSGMFSGCKRLSSVDLGSFNTSNVTNMADMFWNCNELTSLDVSSFDTSNVTNMMEMFGGCKLLTSLDVNNFNTSNVTNMQSLFGGCAELQTLDVSNFDTSNVTNMNAMFDGCEKLNSINLSSFNTSNVTDMPFMFSRCKELTSLDLSNFNTSNVTNMMGVFESCSQLVSLDISSFDTSNVTNMSNMFGGCISLASIDLSSFDTHNVTGMNEMFGGCTNLNLIKVDGSKFNTTNVTDSDYMFSCFKLIGYQGTKYDVSHRGVSYAHLDAADTGNPGYFSEFPRIFIYDGTTRLSRKDYTMADIGHTVTEPTKPTKEGYYFGGWYKEEALTNEFNFATDTLPGNMFLYVKWTTTPPTPPTPDPPTPAGKKIKTIDITTKPKKTVYTVDDYINPTGLVIKVTYDDNTTDTVTYNDKTKEYFSFKPTPDTPLTTNDKEVVITYGEKTTSFSITVEKKSDPEPYNPGGGGGNSGGGSDPTKGPMGDLTKNPEYAKLLDPLANPLPVNQTLNKTNDLPQENLIYDAKLIDALKAFPENANPTKANVEDTEGNKGYGEWLNLPKTTNWYFLTGNLKPEDIATMSTKESGGFLRNGWYNLGWKGENKWYHFNTGGVMDIGWYTENNLIYYLEADLQDNWYGKAVTGTKVIDGITYNFGTNGALIP